MAEAEPASRWARLAVLAYLLLLLALFAAKLARLGPVATWSWWLVTSGLWLPWALIAGVGGWRLLVRVVRGHTRF